MDLLILNGWAEPEEEPGAIKMVNLLCGQLGRKWQQSATQKNLSQLFQHYFTLAENYFPDFLDMENIEAVQEIRQCIGALNQANI